MSGPTATGWTELRIDVPVGAVRAGDVAGMERLLGPLDAVCLELSPGGYAIEGEDAPPGDLPRPEPGTLRVRVFVPDGRVETSLARVSACLGDGYPGGQVAAWPVDPDWQERWKAYFHAIEVSPRLVVRPPWEELTRDRGAEPRLELVIEPGMAFGTGQHETTQLCLRLLDDLAQRGELPHAVLDVGCGTGILGIGAALLGARRVVGIDVDEPALLLARENARLNGLADHALELSATPVGGLGGAFPLVLANIMAHILIPMRGALLERTAPGGLLVLSGIVDHQEAAVRERFEERGSELELVGRAAAADWIRLDYRRR